MEKWRLASIVGLALLASSAVTSHAAGGQRDMNHLKASGGLASTSSPLWVQKRPIPLDVHFAVAHDLSRTDMPYDRGRIRTRETPAGDPGVAFRAGDAVLTGTEGETWPIARTTFEATYVPLSGAAMGHDGKFYKKPLPILAVQMSEPFFITASWGLLEGQAGDWLVQYDEAGQDFGIVGRALFAQTYQQLDVTPELRSKLATMRNLSKRLQR